MSNPIKINDNTYDFSRCTREQLQAFTEVFFELAAKQCGFGYFEWCSVADAAEIKPEKKSDVVKLIGEYVVKNISETLKGPIASCFASQIRDLVARYDAAVDS